jgi:eukaryotic-like serine/threonine-protein kinase
MTETKLEILGRYRILDIVGRGAMGIVYKAVDPVIDRVVAIKTVNLSLSKDDVAEYEARFQQEIKAAGRLNHPNIVTIYDVGRNEEIAYMAMEFLEGKELKDLLATGDRPDVETTVDLMAQVADGLAFAHEREIVHRDIKPSNIMVMKVANGVLAKITDFGIARMPASAVKTMTGMILGSPRYMSPEQVIGKAIDYRSDIFSLGVVLYETLTGIAPFDGDNVNAIMYATVNTVPVPPSTLNIEVPTMLDMIIAKALSKTIEDRYQSMREFGADLREVKRLLMNARGGPSVYAAKEQAPARPVVPEPVPMAGRRQKEVAGETDSRALTLAKQFDSFEATMRLATLTKQTEEFREYISETQKMRAYKGKIEGPLAAKSTPTPVAVPAAPAAPVATKPTPTPAPPPAPQASPPAPKPAPVFRNPDIGDTTVRLEARRPVVTTQSMVPMIVLGALALTALGLLIALLVR